MILKALFIILTQLSHDIIVTYKLIYLKFIKIHYLNTKREKTKTEREEEEEAIITFRKP